ncbi:hypothetical protein PV08_04194 [Exophiala spinifera]|uniref:F-box domain-containing protein n=1 Tax=Exophiala spinifera TaxID=91928 RepID=A0A0D2BDL6_9EURO|nr:uncharacterized protein PV08_04194 [Exophiala spinifera]KIW17003.1 hypothetical protein PV08_04194 [Exophiala spinifera]
MDFTDPLHRRDATLLRKRRRTPGTPDRATGSPLSRSFSGEGTLAGQSSDDRLPRKKTKLFSPLPGHSLPRQGGESPRIKRTMEDLPDTILRHIFAFVHPITLGRLICVNRRFRSLLDPSIIPLQEDFSPTTQDAFPNQNDIWTASRKRFLQGFPRPLKGLTELDMWRLIRSRSCQFCHAVFKKERSETSTSPWSAGPGPGDVRSIWPFRIRSCGRCLEKRTIKEKEVLITGSSALLPGLPYAILTSSWDYIPSTILERADPPPDVQLAKYYLRAQLEEMRTERANVQALGTAALEEWYKGLESTGRGKMLDAARLDQWELQDGPSKIAVPIAHKAFDITQTTKTPLAQDRPLSAQTHPMQVNQSITLPPSVSGDFSPSSGSMEIDTARSNTSTSFRQASKQRSEKSKEEAEQAMLARRKEIEQRCLAMRPPILPSTLPFMEAFKASIKIAMPLTEGAWEILKPRLLAQRVTAEREERRQIAASHDMKADERELFEEEQRVAQENEANMWAELKIPSRDRIQHYAREFIRQTWSDGRGVTKATASKFAAEVLCHVRQRFGEDLAGEDRMLALKGTAFPQDSESLHFRSLKLKDMKWTFDELVKPHTERFGKDLFLCRVCDNTQKLFSFEAVVQHYAAKHTHELSHGNAVVYWDADWPVEPPFDPSPNIPWVQDQNHNLPQNSQQQLQTPAWQPPTGIPSRPQQHVTIQNPAVEVTNLVIEYWRRTDGVWDLSNPVRLYVIIYHVNLRFRRMFNFQLGLPLFRDVSFNRSELYFLRSLSGLRCAICAESLRSIPSRQGEGNGIEHDVPNLLSHFQSAHCDPDASSSSLSLHGLPQRPGQGVQGLDWTRDMILLPSSAAIMALRHSRGIDDDKFQVITEAFPNMWLYPAPQFDAVPLESLSPRTRNVGARDGGTWPHMARLEKSGSAREDDYHLHSRGIATVQRHPRQGRAAVSPLPHDLHGHPAEATPSTRYPPRQEYHSRLSESSPAWEMRSRPGPLSRDSLVYSYEDESSKWSYREPLTAYSETTISEARPSSKTGSRHSFRLSAPSQHSAPQDSLGDLESTAAADFLANFDPTTAEGPSQIEGGSGTSFAPRTGSRPPDLPDSRPGTGISTNPLPHRPFLDAAGANARPLQRMHMPALAMYEGGRTMLHNDGQAQPRSYEIARHPSLVSNLPVNPEGHGDRADDIPGLPHRPYHDDDFRQLNERAIGDAEPQPPTGAQYYHEDRYRRRPKQYETSAEMTGRGYRRPAEEAPAHYVEFRGERGRSYVEHEPYMDERMASDEAVRLGSRDAGPHHSEYRTRYYYEGNAFPSTTERYSVVEPINMTRRAHVVTNDDREVIYEAPYQTRRYEAS